MCVCLHFAAAEMKKHQHAASGKIISLRDTHREEEGEEEDTYAAKAHL